MYTYRRDNKQMICLGIFCGRHLDFKTRCKYDKIVNRALLLLFYRVKLKVRKRKPTVVIVDSFIVFKFDEGSIGNFKTVSNKRKIA